MAKIKGYESDVPSFKLNDSNSMPALGLGTFAGPEPAEEAAVKAAVLKALEIGYRHIDTASMYNSEQGIGQALQEAFAAGTVKREDIFLTTKIMPNQLHVDEILPTIKQSLRNLQLDYLELYLIHWPIRNKHGVAFGSTNPDDYLPLDLKSTWEVMERLVKLGLTKSIGVSNFCVKRLQELLSHATLVPAVNQIELHPQWQQDKVRAFCKKKGIHVSAWSPLGAPGGYGGLGGSVNVTNNPIIKQLAEKHGKSPAQIALRWIYEVGAISTPKSYNEARMIENISIWDCSLSEEDHEKIKSIQQANLSSMMPQFQGFPWRNFEEFWDNDE